MYLYFEKFLFQVFKLQVQNDSYSAFNMLNNIENIHVENLMIIRILQIPAHDLVKTYAFTFLNIMTEEEVQFDELFT